MPEIIRRPPGSCEASVASSLHISLALHLSSKPPNEIPSPIYRPLVLIVMQSNAPLPLKQYFLLLTSQSCLLIASLLYLPRSSSWLFGPAERQPQRSSADRPEHPFLTPLTADPLSTMMCVVGGTFVIMVWWGQHMRTWWTSSPAGNEKRAAAGDHSERVGQSTARVSCTARAG